MMWVFLLILSSGLALGDPEGSVMEQLLPQRSAADVGELGEVKQLLEVLAVQNRELQTKMEGQQKMVQGLIANSREFQRQTAEQLKNLAASNGGMKQTVKETQQLKSKQDKQLKTAGTTTCTNPMPRDCAEVLAQRPGKVASGVYTVYVGITQRPVQVYCDMTTNGGGWLVFQRRQNGRIDFYRNWVNYSAGFGDLNDEFWLGNDILHALTAGRSYRIRFDLGDWKGNYRYAEYADFKVASACEKYKISFSTYCGNAGDSFSYQLGGKFSTYDQDNEGDKRHCAVTFKGGWWYTTCRLCNLNSLYLGGPHTSYADGVDWRHWKGDYYSLKFTEMKLRPDGFL